MAKFLMTELVPSRAPITARLGSATGSANYLGDEEVGKIVKLAGDSRYDLAVVGDTIEGFINSIEPASVDDYSIGSVQLGDRKAVTFDGLEATPGTGVIAVGEYVVTGTPVAEGTALTVLVPAKVCSATNQPGTAAAAAGVATQTIAIPVALADVTAAGDVLTDYIPGYAFKLVKAQFGVGTPVTTAAKAADIVCDIEATEVTGGLIELTSALATPLGVVLAGTAITALNTGTALEKISVRAEAVTAFAEGTGYVLLTIQNLDTLNALNALSPEVGQAPGWRVLSLGTAGTGAVNTVGLMERVL